MIKFDIPEDMDVPELRRIKSEKNKLWLLRNLFVRNSNHPEFNEVLKKIKDCNFDVNVV